MYLLLKDKINVGFGEMNIKGEWWILSKKSWERKECDGCKSYNPECRMGACSIYPYQKKKTEVKKVEIHDTG